MKIPPDHGTYFINVDLDILSRRNLQALVTDFGKRVFVLYVGPEGRRHGAHLELSGSALRGTADSLILRFAALVQSLSPSARELWDTAVTRNFNIGVQAGAVPFSTEFVLQPKTLQSVAGIGAGVVFTVYAPDKAAHGPSSDVSPDMT
jgi:hypothetical protein